MRSTVRMLAALIGLALVGVAADRAVAASGGYGSSEAPQIIALAVGLAVGGFFATRAIIERRWLLASVLGLAALACEVPMVLSTLGRVAASAEANRAPAIDHARRVAQAQTRVDNANAALSAVPETSVRLSAALAAKASADAAVISKAAEKNCGANCRELLHQQVAVAAAEIEAGRAELAAQRTAAKRELSDARAALAAIGPAPASGSAAADLLGVPPWLEALIRAVATALGLNVMGAALLAYSTHAPVAARPRRTATTMPSFEMIEARPIGDVETWLRSALVRRRGRGGIGGQEAYLAYVSWCESQNLEPASPQAFGQVLYERARSGAMTLVPAGDDVFIAGARLALPSP